MCEIVIYNPSDKSSIKVNWGCESGDVTCQLITNCNALNLTRSVRTETIEISGMEKVESYSENNKYNIQIESFLKYQISIK